MMMVQQATLWANRWGGVLVLMIFFVSARNSHARPNTIIGPELSRDIGRRLFRAHPDIEASGLVWLPHEHLLAGVSDTGDVFMINPDDEREYYVAPKILGESADSDYHDFEGVTFDPYLIETEDDNHIYIACENPPALLQLRYRLPKYLDDHTFASVDLYDTAELDDALPSSFHEKKGIESLTLYKPSTATSKAVFFIGLQDNGSVYQVDSDGRLISSADIISVDNGDIDQRDVSGSHYDASTDTLFLVYDKQNAIAAVEVETNRVLATYRTRDTQEEGIAVRDDRIYICSDEAGDEPSFISEHAWFPELPTPRRFPLTTTTMLASAAAVPALLAVLIYHRQLTN